MKLLELEKLANQFVIYAQDASVQTNQDLPETIRKTFGKGIFDLASSYLSSKSVSSIPISIQYDKPKALFEVTSTGADANTVDTELKAALDRKYGMQVASLIGKHDPSATSFRFGLMTVE